MDGPKVLRVPPLAILVALNATWSSAQQLMLPALSVIAKDLGTTTAGVQAILTVYMAAVAIGQLVYGPLSDRYGRKAPLLVGLVVFTLSSVACALAPTLPVLLLASFAQGFGACAGAVLSRAMVRDSFTSDVAAIRQGQISMAMTIAPVIVTIAGGLLVSVIGWRSMYFIVTLAGAVLVVLIARSDETNQSRIAVERPRVMLRTYVALVTNRGFAAPALATSLMGASFTTFCNIAPLVLQDAFGVSSTHFGQYFMMLPAGFLIGAFTSTKLIHRLGPQRTARYGSMISVTMAVGMFALTLSGHATAALWFMAMGLVTIGQGLMAAASVVMALSANPRLVGAASGFLGFMTMSCSAALTQISGLVYNGTALTTALIVVVADIAALLVLLVLQRPVVR